MTFIKLQNMMLINYRRKKNYHFAVEKPGRHHLDQVRKLTSWVIRGTDIMYPQHDALKRYNATSAVLLPKTHTWHSTVRKHQANPSCRTAYI